MPILQWVQLSGGVRFKGVYDNHVHVAKDLDDAYNIAEKICSGFDYEELPPYFEEHYYSNLKELFENENITY